MVDTGIEGEVSPLVLTINEELAAFGQSTLLENVDGNGQYGPRLMNMEVKDKNELLSNFHEYFAIVLPLFIETGYGFEGDEKKRSERIEKVWRSFEEKRLVAREQDKRKIKISFEKEEVITLPEMNGFEMEIVVARGEESEFLPYFRVKRVLFDGGEDFPSEDTGIVARIIAGQLVSLKNLELEIGRLKEERGLAIPMVIQGDFPALKTLKKKT